MRLVRCQADQFLKYVVDFLLVRAQFPRLCGGVRKIITCILSLLKLVEAGVCADVHRAVERLSRILAFLRADERHVPGKLVEGVRPARGGLFAPALVLHENDLLWISVLDVANGPIGTLLGNFR